MFAALGRFSYRFRRWIPPVGLALVIGLTVWSNQAGGQLSQGGWQIAGSASRTTEELLADRFGEQATAIFVILRDPAGDAASPEFQQVVADAVARVLAGHGSPELVGPGSGPAGGGEAGSVRGPSSGVGDIVGRERLRLTGTLALG